MLRLHRLWGFTRFPLRQAFKFPGRSTKRHFSEEKPNLKPEAKPEPKPENKTEPKSEPSETPKQDNPQPQASNTKFGFKFEGTKPNQEVGPSRPDPATLLTFGTGLAVLSYWLYSLPSTQGKEIPFSEAEQLILGSKVSRLDVKKMDNGSLIVTVVSAGEEKGNLYFMVPNAEILEEQLASVQDHAGIDPFHYVPVRYYPHLSLPFGFADLIWIGIAGYFFWSIFKRGGAMSGGPGQIFNFGKSKAKKFDMMLDTKTSFKDVAGCKEAKHEIQEFVNFLKEPAKYQRLGAKIPRGTLLVGPPGTGKTLLARATAGEAGVPFFSISGSDFIEMFVGVGPSRVRDLFATARQHTPCIIFIDEIDAIGRARAKAGGSNDERENTLNQLLVEMDGFDTSSNVVVMAGTNRVDVLDKALIRPGRFDRQISFDLPDLDARREILAVHMKPLTVDPTLVEELTKRIAVMTPGFSGADLSNVCNEAALIAARHSKATVVQSDFEAAIERIIGGLEKKNRILSAKEKTTVAYHEAGHALVGWILTHTDPLLKVSIVPRGVAALGYAMYQPKDRYLYSREQLFDRMCMTLGGRIAEKLVFNSISTGAADDLQKVTDLAYQLVAIFGMSEKLGYVSFPPDQQVRAERPYSEATAELIDSEVGVLIDQAYNTAQSVIQEYRHKLEEVAQILLQKEVLTDDDLVSILGPRKEKRTFDELTSHRSVADA